MTAFTFTTGMQQRVLPTTRQIGGCRQPQRPFSSGTPRFQRCRTLAVQQQQQQQSSQEQQHLEAGLALPPPQAVPVEVQVVEATEPAMQQPSTSHAANSVRWVPASLLSGWKGTGSLMLSLGAVTGGGLMGSGFDLSGPGSVLQALGVLALTVGIHEAGHFWAAVSRGIHVTKFAIGFGPTLASWKGKAGVEYSLRALPLGGFVAFPDDDPDSTIPPDDPNLLRNRGVGDRTAVVTAGVAANMALAFAICLLQASTVGIAEPVYKPGVKLGDIEAGTIAARAGLRRGDIVLEVGDQLVAPRPGAVMQVVNAIKASPGRELPLLVERGGERLTIPVTPYPSAADGTGRIGIKLAANADLVNKRGEGLVGTLTLAGQEYMSLAGNVVKGLWQFVSNFSSTVDNVSGPVAILAAGAEVARTSQSGLLQFAALININLAIVNILPLPALDGGYLVFIALEAARGKKVDEKLEKGIMAGGFLLLMTAGVVLIVKDTFTLTGVSSMLQ